MKPEGMQACSTAGQLKHKYTPKHCAMPYAKACETNSSMTMGQLVIAELHLTDAKSGVEEKQKILCNLATGRFGAGG